MKKSLALLITAGCLAWPAIIHADTPAKKEKTRQKAAVATAAPKREQTIYYISPEAATGSHIPMVRRSYNGYIDSASSPAAYGATRIQQTGSLDVATALYKLDSSISIGRGR